MNTKTKRAVAIVAAVCVVAALILFVPFPQRIHKTLSGAELSGINGTIIADPAGSGAKIIKDVEIELKGWHLRSLLSKPSIFVKVQIEETDLSGMKTSSWYSQMGDIRTCLVLYYDGRINENATGTMRFTKDWNHVMITGSDGVAGERVFVGSAAGKDNLDAIFQTLGVSLTG